MRDRSGYPAEGFVRWLCGGVIADSPARWPPATGLHPQHHHRDTPQINTQIYMSRLLIKTNVNIDLEFEIPEFYKRMLAWLIDTVLLLIYLFFAFYFLVDYLQQSDGLSDNTWTNLNFLSIALFMPVGIYSVLMEISLKGQTVGKRIMHIKVINEDGGNATISQFISRWLIKVSDAWVLLAFLTIGAGGFSTMVLFLICFFLADVFCIAFTKKSQRLGDMAAGTILISTKAKASLEETVFVEIADSYVPRYPEVMRLSDRDLNIIRGIFNTATKRTDYALAIRTGDKVKSVLKIQSDEDPIDFLETLLKDYNYLSTR